MIAVVKHIAAAGLAIMLCLAAARAIIVIERRIGGVVDRAVNPAPPAPTLCERSKHDHG